MSEIQGLLGDLYAQGRPVGYVSLIDLQSGTSVGHYLGVNIYDDVVASIGHGEV